MQELIGKHFKLEDLDYAITDVRNIGVDLMVYAQPSDDAGYRAAFRYIDIQAQLESPAEA